MTLPKQFSKDNTENIRIYHYVEELIGSFKGYVGGMFDDDEITFSESSLLIRIHFLGQCGQNDLVETFKASEGHVSRILRKFEDLELIERFENPQNHRKKIVKLTDQGQKIAEMGSSGGVKTPQLHFEIRYKAKVVNPKQYLP